MSFLPINPRNLTFQFTRPRENTQSDSGANAIRYSSVGYMQGTIRVPRTQDTQELMLALAKADAPGGYFFADLILPENTSYHLESGFPEPRWVRATLLANAQSINPSIQVHTEPGSIISIRSATAGTQEYVTARILTEVIGGPPDTLSLNHPLPFEFFPGNSSTALIDVCVNRPHVRAVFKDDTVQWSLDYHRTARVSTMNWEEDTAAIISSLRASDHTGTPTPPPGPPGDDNYILLENGGKIELEDGSGYLVQEG